MNAYVQPDFPGLSADYFATSGLISPQSLRPFNDNYYEGGVVRRIGIIIFGSPAIVER
jgi:hypothetical protein